MKKNKDIGTSFLLMAGSLLLLLVFVFLWLQRVYQDEYNNLQREVDFLFINSIRDYEDELFRNMGDKPVILQMRDTSNLSIIERTGKAITLIDSIIINDTYRKEDIIADMDSMFENKQFIRTIVMEGDDFSGKHPDANVKVKIHTGEVKSQDKFDGSLSFYIEMSGEKSDFSLSDSVNIQQLIGERFSKALTLSDTKFPANYEIYNQRDSSFTEGKLISKEYRDVFSGESFAVEFSDYKVFILKVMWPEIAFSFLLLGSITLTFFLIYRSLKRERRLTALKNDFISNITHELKTPITTVGVAIEALRNFDVKSNPERLKEYLDISKNELNRLSILVDKVLKMSLFEKRAPTLNIEEIDFEEIISSVTSSMKLQFEKDAAEVNFKTIGSGFVMKGDRVHLTNVVYNLLENALKYSKEKPQVEILLEKKGEKIIMRVSDRGVGIPQVYLNKVFDKFFRVPTGDKHNVKGHGLGLTYVASVVRQHGGTIIAEHRKDGEGTCFELSFD